ncbi:Rpn family recombination-promoting nuclease/putative transposase [Phormidium sp. LEGE 05292]|uniref:Rpn family recombination-promoting nuclease/putative transposase n=1 Tax=[Phormidium] sp. LEGE 05292 TaxID=767427 RepID=UPI00187DE6FB|nr:Rpn family recombination-promoting nuclease/putative transposase [Phormidium sp. LEGE 05292]MBE9229172.1 Rpn family recombination-promoting nuclease/putative transposase [Phormidium sp. LEGE 05292]
MKTNSLFYHILQSFPSIFFELIGHPPTETSGYEFQSVEIKDTNQIIDGIFVPAKRTRQPIYFVDVQSQFDEDFYYRFFTEIFLYLGKNKSNRDWFAVAIYPRRFIEPVVPRPYQWLVESDRIKRLYLDELGLVANQSLGLGMLKLLVEDEAKAQQRAEYLIHQIQQVTPISEQLKLGELLTKILAYKFPQLGIQELTKMFELSDLKQSKLYQEAKTEGKLETVPLLLELGLTVERIAQELHLDIVEVKKAAKDFAGQETTLE